MKAFTLLLTLLLLPFDAWSAPRDDLRHNQRVRRAAMELFRSDSTASALSHLRRTLRPEAAAGGDQTTLAQSLIEIAGEFYNRRELPLARQAALQAQLAAEPILAGRSPATASRRAQLYLSLGVLHETVLFDEKAAIACYDAAVALQPADPVSRSRRSLTSEKLQRRNGGAR
jgi:hypothetical protein